MLDTLESGGGASASRSRHADLGQHKATRRGGGGGGGATMLRRGSWEDSVAARHHHYQQQQQQPRRDEDLALFQDMRIREESNGGMETAMDHHLRGSARASYGAGRGGGAAAAAAARSRASNDLLTSETDKNDYDWLLTPPGTPLFPSLDRDWLAASPSQREKEREKDPSRWPSKLSRLSTPDTQQLMVSSSSSGSSGGSASKLYTGSNCSSMRGNPSPRRQSAPPSTASFSSSKPKSQVVSTSVVANNGYGNARPSTPTRRPSTAPSPSLTSSARRPSTPTPTSSMPRSSTVSRPSTPTRPSPASSRSSTPTRRSSTTSSATTPSSALLTSSISNGRSSRGTSPVRRPQPPAVTAHERSSSNSRAAAISKADVASTTTLPSHLTRSYNHLDRDMSNFSRRAVTSTNDAVMHPKSEPLRKPATTKVCSGSRETSFYGTSISKKSLDTAIRHMDIRRSSPSGFRCIPAVASPFPKSATVARSSHTQQQQPYDRLLLSEQLILQRQEQQQREREQHSTYEKEFSNKPVELFEHDSLDATDGFLLELTETRFLEDASYLKDPPDLMK